MSDLIDDPKFPNGFEEENRGRYWDGEFLDQVPKFCNQYAREYYENNTKDS